MIPINVTVIRDENGVPTQIILNQAGRRLNVVYDRNGGFKLQGSMPKRFADVLAMQAAYGRTAIDITAQTVGNLAVDIAANTVGNLPIDIAAQTIGNLAIDLAAQSLGNLDVNLAAQAADIDVNLNANSIGNLPIDINAQTIGDLDVNLNAQTAAIHIDTATADNIVIDALTQDAYTEDRRTLSNNGASPTWQAITGANRRGKFFPRGCRGFMDTVDAYCRDNAAAGGTITVYVAPCPGMGYTYTADVTVAPGGAAAWRSATFRQFWNYDSMFVWFVCSNADIQFSYDTGTPYDNYVSADSGANFTTTTSRAWIRVNLSGETVGDLPVSGTVNNVPLPNQSTEETNSTGSVSSTETVFLTINGAGFVDFLHVHINAADASHHTNVLVYCDGEKAFENLYSQLSATGYTANTPSCSLLAYGADALCALLLTKKFEFKRKFQVALDNDVTTGAPSFYIKAIPNLIS